MAPLLQLVPPPDDGSIGKRIRTARGHRSQAEVAAKVNISVKTLQNWEADRHSPTVDGIKRISKCTGWPVTYLLGDLDDDTPPTPDGDPAVTDGFLVDFWADRPGSEDSFAQDPVAA